MNYLTINQTAEKLAISQGLVRKLAAMGEIQQIRFGRCCRIDGDSLDAYVNRRRKASIDFVVHVARLPTKTATALYAMTHGPKGFHRRVPKAAPAATI